MEDLKVKIINILKDIEKEKGKRVKKGGGW